MEIKLKEVQKLPKVGDFVILPKEEVRLVIENNGYYSLVVLKSDLGYSVGEVSVDDYDSIDGLLEGMVVDRIIPHENIKISEK